MKKYMGLLGLLILLSTSIEGIEYDARDQKRLEAVENFIEKVEENARSKENPTPLLGDGLNVYTDEVVVWIFEDGRRAKISNFASQQNYLRTLIGLSVVTKNPLYKMQAREMAGYFMDNYTNENGLFYWGGHRFINLDTGEVEGPQGKGLVHELKNHFPYIDFLHSVDSKKTERFARQFWNAHVEDWKTLDMGRHGSYSKSYNGDIFKTHKKIDIIDKEKLPKLPETKGLTFLSAVNDLMYFGHKLTLYTGEEEAMEWSKHVAKQYVDARNPDTGMPVSQFSSPIRRDEPTDDRDTSSKYGDRAYRQFGPEFGYIAQEGNAIFRNARSITRENTIIQIEIAKESGDKEFLQWTLSGLINYYKNAYDAKTNTIIPMWNDGTILTGYELQRDGYYGEKGKVITIRKANFNDLLPLVRASVYNDYLWRISRIIAYHLGLGDIGNTVGKEITLNLKVDTSNPIALLTVLDLYRYSEDERYLELGRVIGDNIIKNRMVNGYFVTSKDHLYSSIDSTEALALVTLDAALKGKIQDVPRYLSEGGYLHGDFLYEDGSFKTTYDKNIYYYKRKR